MYRRIVKKLVLTLCQWYYLANQNCFEPLSFDVYGASEASVVFRRLTEISEYERPAVVTRLRGSYLSNHLTDLHAAIFVG